MPVFGPYYPPLLQVAVSHAERLAALLADIEARRPPTDDAARAWSTRRSEEVETIVGCIVEDWRSGRATEEAAEEAASAYLRAVHVGARRHLGFGQVPPCCLGDVETTTVPQDVTMPMSAASPLLQRAGDGAALGAAPPSPTGGDTIAVGDVPFPGFARKGQAGP